MSSFIWNEKFFSWLNVKSYFRAKSFETNLSFKKKKKELFRAHKTISFSIILFLKRTSCLTDKQILFAFHKIYSTLQYLKKCIIVSLIKIEGDYIFLLFVQQLCQCIILFDEGHKEIFFCIWLIWHSFINSLQQSKY